MSNKLVAKTSDGSIADPYWRNMATLWTLGYLNFSDIQPSTTIMKYKSCVACGSSMGGQDFRYAVVQFTNKGLCETVYVCSACPTSAKEAKARDGRAGLARSDG